MRDCKKHACNRKCCIGDCPPCEQPCNKQLSCKNHKCASRCHPSSCYPCNQTKEISCFCGHSRFLVPCGMERVTKPPKCRIKCKEPPNCHHPSRAQHSCHCPSHTVYSTDLFPIRVADFLGHFNHLGGRGPGPRGPQPGRRRPRRRRAGRGGARGGTRDGCGARASSALV